MLNIALPLVATQMKVIPLGSHYYTTQFFAGLFVVPDTLQLRPFSTIIVVLFINVRAEWPNWVPQVLMHTGALGQQLNYVISEVNESLESVRDALHDLFAALKELVATPVDTASGANAAVVSSCETSLGTMHVAAAPLVTVTGCRCALQNHPECSASSSLAMNACLLCSSGWQHLWPERMVQVDPQNCKCRGKKMHHAYARKTVVQAARGGGGRGREDGGGGGAGDAEAHHVWALAGPHPKQVQWR